MRIVFRLGDKESYMVFMNSFMQAHSDEMRAFLDDISQVSGLLFIQVTTNSRAKQYCIFWEPNANIG